MTLPTKSIIAMDDGFINLIDCAVLRSVASVNFTFTQPKVQTEPGLGFWGPCANFEYEYGALIIIEKLFS